MGKGPDIPKPEPPPPPPPPAPTRGQASSIQNTQQQKSGEARKGVGSTILTNASSALSDENLNKKTLLGGK